MQSNADYRKTLNLPKTGFSMRAGLAQKEPVFLKKWEEGKLYQKLRQKAGQAKERFILHDGPPYANGNIHIGHALNKILKDCIVKYKTMRGYDSLYVPGWDCHGLPIEHQLFKELKTDKSKIDCITFRRKAREYALKYVAIQREQFQRLGVFGQWEEPYVTLAPEYEYWILRSLNELNKKGFLYRGLKPVNWCYHCETALAEAEVEYEDHTSPSVYVKFQVSNPGRLAGLETEKDVSLLVWTTTPWTLIANVAVAVKPDFRYALVETDSEILILERSLVDRVLPKGSVAQKGFSVRKEVDGKDVCTLVYRHPLGLRDECPVVEADYVTREEGTGLVHTAPGHGHEDFLTGIRFNLDTVMPVDDKGCFTDAAGEFQGQHVFKANPAIIRKLRNSGRLFHEESLEHSYPHCWRCKNPIIFRATEQWFLKIDHENLRSRLMEMIRKDVRWIPPAGKDRILAMVANRPDWCLSRQRYWGVPIPAVICTTCRTHTLFSGLTQQFADSVRRQGTNIWFEKDLHDWLAPDTRCPQCKGTHFEKSFEILDVWFDSGVSHQAVIKAMMGAGLPADLYLEGSDQHRGWFQSSLIPAVGIEDRPPFKAVLTHGFVVDGQGRKMSKSLGNVISPQDIVKHYGADILRLWVAASNYCEDIRLSKEILERLIDGYRKIRNTVRFLLGNLDGFNVDEECLGFDQLGEIDRWALVRLASIHRDVTEGYESYDFMKVYRTIYNFCNDDLSSIYLDIIKDRLYTSASTAPGRKSAQTVLFHILRVMGRDIAPILIFTAQEIFEAMPKARHEGGAENIHLADWPEIPPAWETAGANSIVARLDPLIYTFRPKILKALEEERQKGTIGLSLDAKVVLETSDEKTIKYLQGLEGHLPSYFIVSQVEVQRGREPFNIHVMKADGKKCARCWNYRADVGMDRKHPFLCTRCVHVIKESQNGQ